MLHDVDLAEDAVQRTMLQMLCHWEQARAEPEAYSHQVLINVCRDHWRRQRHRPEEIPLAGTGAETVIDQTVSFVDCMAARDEVVRALASLPGRQREVLALRFLLDFSVEQTAEALKIPEGTVKSATHRGFHELRRLLSPTETELGKC